MKAVWVAVKRPGQPCTRDPRATGAVDQLLVHRILLPDDNCLGRFCDFLRAVQVQVHEAGADGVLASVPGAVTPQHERRELFGYVTTWNALNPTVQVELR